MEQDEKYKLPMLSPKFINDNNLWDSIWLMKKYPDNHLNKDEHLKAKANIGRGESDNELLSNLKNK